MLHNYSNVTDPLIIPLIFFFLSCREKAHDKKEFSREDSKPRRESRITTHQIEPCIELFPNLLTILRKARS